MSFVGHNRVTQPVVNTPAIFAEQPTANALRFTRDRRVT
ncbi:hypothetical protein TNCV_5036711, partial [Trichonephila clavipes]